MFGTKMLRGASAGALTLFLFPSSAFAQEPLPTIEVGAPRRVAAKPKPQSAPARTSSGPAIVAPAAGVQLADPVVPGGRNDPAAYSKPDTTLATKTNTPIMQTPASVVVVPQQVLRDQQVTTLGEALQNVSNVYTIENGGLQSGFLVRGFENYKYFIDGVRVDNFITPIKEETADMERIEVLKGPASILYGRMEPGGIINMSTKPPLATPYTNIQQQIGSYDFYRTTLDTTGPVTSDNSLLYRFNLAYENAGSFREFDHNHRIFVSPRVHWVPTEDTQFNFYLRYLNGAGPIELGTPILLDALGRQAGIAPVPRSRNYGEPGSQVNNSNLRVGFNWSHAFNVDWSLTHRFDANFVDTDSIPLIAYGPLAPCDLTTCPVQRLINKLDPKSQAYYTSLELTGHFNTLALSHTLLFGTDLYLYHDGFTRAFNFEVPNIDLWNPIHTGLPTYLLGFPDSLYTVNKGQRSYGLYLQDQIELPYNFHLLAGFRYDNVSAYYTQVVTVPAPTQVNSGKESAAVVKPRVGLLWQPIPQLSLFGDYVEGFGVATLFPNDTPNQFYLPPEQSRQWEAGVKTSFLDNRLTSTLAWFDIIKTNVPAASPDPTLAALGIQVPTGAVRNRGVDFDVSGQLTPELKVIGGFAYIDSKIAKDDNGNLGHRFYGVPRVGGNLWAVYEPQVEMLRGWAVGAGFFARGNFALNNANTFFLPGYTTVNFMTRYAFTYEKTKLTFQLNINNLFDKTYYNVFGGGGQVFPGTPRTFLGSVKVEF